MFKKAISFLLALISFTIATTSCQAQSAPRLLNVELKDYPSQFDESDGGAGNSQKFQEKFRNEDIVVDVPLIEGVAKAVSCTKRNGDVFSDAEIRARAART